MFGARLVLLVGLAAAASAMAIIKEEYFLVRPDVRKCAFPRCGGFFLNPVNIEKFDCPGGEVSRRNECYVAEIQGMEVTKGLSMVKGRFVPYGRGQSSDLNAFVATEGFEGKIHPHPFNNPDGLFAVSDLSIACITAPCNSFHAKKLNERMDVVRRMLFADVDLSAFSESEQEVRALMHVSEVVFSASAYKVEGPGGVGQGLRVSNYFTKILPPAKACTMQKECEKTDFCARETCTSPTGLCKPRPFSCTREYVPVCACDGKREYANDCARQMFGATSSNPGNCPVSSV